MRSGTTWRAARSVGGWTLRIASYLYAAGAYRRMGARRIGTAASAPGDRMLPGLAFDVARALQTRRGYVQPGALPGPPRRAVRPGRHGAGDAAEQEALGGAQAARTEDDAVRLPLLRLVDQRRFGSAIDDGGRDLEPGRAARPRRARPGAGWRSRYRRSGQLQLAARLGSSAATTRTWAGGIQPRAATAAIPPRRAVVSST